MYVSDTVFHTLSIQLRMQLIKEVSIFMKEVKNPRRPMLYYWGLVLLILLVLNIAVVPLMRQHSVREVGYNTFISMTDKHEIKEVKI